MGQNQSLLLGEVDHTWQIDVEPLANYAIIVESKNSSHPINQVAILIQQATESEISYIGDPELYLETSASVNFTAPDQGVILIHISSKIGENQENLGAFTVQLRQAPS